MRCECRKGARCAWCMERDRLAHTAWSPATYLQDRDPGDEDLTVLGRCIHGVDLDREFCPLGCRA